MPAVATALLLEPSSRHPHVSRRAELHGNRSMLRGLRGPRHPWRCEELVPHRPRCSVLLGRKRRLHPPHPYSTRARAAQRARWAMTPAVAAAWTPRPWPRRSCVSRRATLPLRSGYSERAPALIRPRLALPWHTSGTTPPPPNCASHNFLPTTRTPTGCGQGGRSDSWCPCSCWRACSRKEVKGDTIGGGGGVMPLVCHGRARRGRGGAGARSK